MPGIFERLSAPFPPDRVAWRAGSVNKDKTRCMALAYVDAREVMQRLDEVMGPHWQCEYVPIPNGSTCCRIGLLIEGEWIWRSDGAGDTDFEGTKGGYSDAFKRAAVRFGVGRYLYGLEAPWVECEARGRSIVIKDHEIAKLRRLLPAPAAPAAPPDMKAQMKRIAAALDGCGSGAEIDDLLARHADELAAMPEGWRPRWQQQVDAARARVANGVI